MTDLIRLAERVEALTGPDREVDAEIALAVLGGRIERVQDGNTGEIFPVRVYADKAGVTVELHAGIPRYTDSLDAAMTLVLEGVEKELTDIHGVARAAVGLNTDCMTFGEHKGGNLALALTAAALRSLAAQRGQG